MPRACQVAVNISPLQFNRGDFLSLVRSALEESGLSPKHLELELTESVLIDQSERMIQNLAGLKDLGVEVSIDDFGTGYSNLAYLKTFHVSVLKVDRSFISRILSNEQDRVIVEAILQMASQLQLKVVAEGVESLDVANALRDMGCDMGQGYFWSRPLEEESFIQFLVRQGDRSAGTSNIHSI